MPSPFDSFDYKSGLLEEDQNSNPFDGLQSLPREAPMPPRRPQDISAPVPAAGSTTTGEQSMSWSDVAGHAWKNAIPSAKSTALGMVEPFLSPVQTAKTFKDIGAGLLSKGEGALGMKQNPDDKTENEATVNAIGEFYKDRYGSEAGLKKAIAEDPVGVMADVSTLVGGGGSLAARAPGIAGKVGEAARSAGRAIHPVNAAATIASPAVALSQKGLNYILSLKSGAPLDTLNEAYRAGRKGSAAFWGQLTGDADPADIVHKAHDAVEKLSEKRRTDYLTSMTGMAANQTPVDYAPINNALLGMFRSVRHGSRTYRPEAEAMLNKLGREILDWQRTPNTNGVNYHNIEGVDKLKQLVGEMRAGVAPGSPSDRIATKVYNVIRDTLASHDPNYMAAMGEYAEKTDLLKQLRNTLSINPKASVDKTLRQLLLGQKQNSGGKARLLDELKEIDPDISGMIAGHILHPVTPIGLRGNVGAAISAAHGLGAYMGVGDPVSAVVNAASNSPRVVGALNYGVGRLTHPTGGLPLMATGPLDILRASGKETPQGEQDERPYFGDDTERPGRATGGRTGPKAQTAQSLISAVERAKKAVQQQTESILATPDEHVVKALSVANKHL